MASSKNQIAVLKKKLEEVEKAKALAEKARDEAKKTKDEAEQYGYDVGVAKTKDALRVEVLAVCRVYCALVWTKPSIKLELRLLLYLGKQKISTTPPNYMPLRLFGFQG